MKVKLGRRHQLNGFAKELRRNMTAEERKLWFQFLKNYVPRVKRQSVIAEYIVDFCCEKAGVIIELDGSQHYETDVQRKDAMRTEKLKTLGYQVIRIPNTEIHYNFSGVKEWIQREISAGMKRRGWEK